MVRGAFAIEIDLATGFAANAVEFSKTAVAVIVCGGGAPATNDHAGAIDFKNGRSHWMCN